MHQMIQSRISELAATIAKLVQHEPAAIIAEQAKAEMPAVSSVFCWDAGMCVNATVSSIHEIADALRWFGARGYHQGHDPLDVPNMQFRSYKLSNAAGLRIDFDVTFTGQSCRYVKVGERAEPVYELRCDDAPVKVAEPELAEAAA